jgi:FkbM family methyltransferase
MIQFRKLNEPSKFKIILIKIIIYLGQKTFLGRGQIRKKIINLINYLIGFGNFKNSRFVCKVNNVPFNFYNDKLTGIKFYFGRNEKNEINFIKKNSFNNSVFIDIGANMGLYTQNIASLNNESKKINIIAVEPNPINTFRLNKNLKLLKKKIPKILSITKIKNCALGNRNKKMNFDFSYGLANGLLTNKNGKKKIIVKCRKLIDIVNEEKLNYITNLKIDIEGSEDLVLIPFFKNCKKKLYPKNIILEYSLRKLWKKDLINFLYNVGYKKIFKNKSNIILSLK